jgi:AcrR family transcriptional regulator
MSYFRSVADTRQRILDIARHLFNQRGLNQVGVRDVARAVGISAGNLAYHFPTKDDLVEALANERFERLREIALEALDKDNPAKAFEDFIRDAARIQADDRALSEVLVTRPNMMRAAAERVGMLELTEQVLKRAQKAGAVRADADPRDIPMVMCAMAGTFHNPFADNDRFIGIVLDGLRAPGVKRAKLPARD